MKEKISNKEYKSQAARDARAQGYGDESYWDMLDETAIAHAAYYTKYGLHDIAKQMLTRSLGEALSGNDGE